MPLQGMAGSWSGAVDHQCASPQLPHTFFLSTSNISGSTGVPLVQLEVHKSSGTSEQIGYYAVGRSHRNPLRQLSILLQQNISSQESLHRVENSNQLVPSEQLCLADKVLNGDCSISVGHRQGRELDVLS